LQRYIGDITCISRRQQGDSVIVTAGGSRAAALELP
jgi:hypothetical protein